MFGGFPELYIKCGFILEPRGDDSPPVLRRRYGPRGMMSDLVPKTSFMRFVRYEHEVSGWINYDETSSGRQLTHTPLPPDGHNVAFLDSVGYSRPGIY